MTRSGSPDLLLEFIVMHAPSIQNHQGSSWSPGQGLLPQ